MNSKWLGIVNSHYFIKYHNMESERVVLCFFKSQILKSSVNFYFQFLLCISSPQTLTVNEITAALIEVFNYRAIPIAASVINPSHLLWKLEKLISI